MAQLALHGDWKGIAGMAMLFVFCGMLAYSMAGGLDHDPNDAAARATKVQWGGAMYLISIVVIVLGFWSKEDVVAVLGIIAISLLMILDVLLKVGVLAFPQLTGT